MYKVRKREGKIVGFDILKIKEAIKKAFDSVERTYDDNVIDFLALKDKDTFVGFMVVLTSKDLAYLFFLTIDSRV